MYTNNRVIKARASKPFGVPLPTNIEYKRAMSYFPTAKTMYAVRPLIAAQLFSPIASTSKLSMSTSAPARGPVSKPSPAGREAFRSELRRSMEHIAEGGVRKDSEVGRLRGD